MREDKIIIPLTNVMSFTPVISETTGMKNSSKIPDKFLEIFNKTEDTFSPMLILRSMLLFMDSYRNGRNTPKLYL